MKTAVSETMNTFTGITSADQVEYQLSDHVDRESLIVEIVFNGKTIIDISFSQDRKGEKYTLYFENATGPIELDVLNSIVAEGVRILNERSG